MLIISKFNDYYDGVVSSVGIDKTIVFNREQKIIERSNIDFPKLLVYEPYKNRYKSNNPFQYLNRYTYRLETDTDYIKIDPFVIGFCGKYFIGWTKEIKEGNNIEKIITYNIEDEDIVDKIKNKSYIFKLESFHDVVHKIKTMDDMTLFRDYKTPIFVVDYTVERKGDDKFIINPSLKEYEFYKIYDSFTAFQEIQMFLTGVLGNNEKEIEEIDDKHKIEQHGFDYKWSFRKEPKKNK